MEKPVDISLLPYTSDSLSSVYANNAEINISPWDVRIVFTELVAVGTPPDVKKVLKANVVMNPGHAKALLGALTTTLDQFEAAFGKINVPDVQPKG